MKRFLTGLLVCFCVCTIASLMAYAKSPEEFTATDLTYITEDYPPYNFADKDGVATGMVTDILVLMFKEMNVALDAKNILVLPWANGYSKAQEVPGTVLFGAAYTEERKDLFKWVGSVVTTDNNILALKSSGIKITSDEDLKKYKIGAVRDDIGEQIMHEKGVTNTDSVSNATLNIRKLYDKKIDLFSYCADVAKWTAKQEGFDPTEMESVAVLGKGAETYFIFHKSTPNAVIAQFQAALNKIKASPEYQAILDKYLK